MKNDIRTMIKKQNAKYKEQKIWKKVVSILSCIAIFITIYFLISPAITQNAVTTYKLHLIDGYDTSINPLYAWKTETPGEYTTSFDLNLHFVDTNGNYIQGKDLTLNLDNVNYIDVAYGFGYTPSDGGRDLIESFNLKEYTLSTGAKYTFDHAEILIDGVWRSFAPDSGTYWHLWCSYSSWGEEPSDKNYGWRGTYEFLNADGTYTTTAYTVTTNTEYKLVFKLVRQGDNTLVSSLGADSGIKFNIFNYSGSNISTGDNNINNNGVYDYFTFRNSATDSSYSINSSIDADGFNDNRAKVLPNLDTEDNPIFDCRNYSGCTNFSLGFLFGSSKNPTGGTPNGVTSYSAQNTLLQKDETTGYYFYDSNQNAVDYDTENNRFMLRNYQERTQTMTTFKNEEGRYEFLPFTYWSGTSAIKTNASNNLTYNYEEADVDHWHGMTMEFTFYMPKGGTINEKDMIFEFSGDDDVWVFIDDVLVLDLGGTHGAVDGSINFKTGEVKSYMNWTDIDNSENPNRTSIYQSYINANATNTTTWNSDNTTYENYTKHTLKFFYLERGAAVANCKIKFNIPVLPSGSLSVQKQYEGTNNYPNDEYEFTIYDVTSETPSPVANAKYTIGTTEYTTDNYGKFKLKSTETAVFKLTNEHMYYVEETNPGTNAISYGCTLDGTTCPEINKTGNVTINPESAYLAIFTNKVKTYNLKVSKVAYSSGIEETFEFKVNLNDSNGSPVDIRDDNNSPNKYTVDHVNGIVTFTLKGGENLTIEDIPVNTIITLQEVNHDGYQTIIKAGETLLANGNTANNIVMDSNKDITVYNLLRVRLPDTGGTGIFKYLIVGIGLILISIGYGCRYLFKWKEGGE